MLDVAALQQENSSLREQLFELRAQLTHLLSGNAELAKTIAKLNERVAELLAVAQRKQRKPSPLRSPEPAPPVEGDAKLAFESRPKPPELPPKTKEKGPRPPPTGRKALPKHLPLDAHDLKPDGCAHCGSTALDVADVVEEEKLDVVKEHQRRRVVFQYEADKASEHLAGKLKQFCGTLTADAEHRLNVVYASGQVLEAGCNAHGVRKFDDAEATQPALAAEGRAFLSAMYVHEARAHELGLAGDALVEHRRRLIRPLAEQLKKWCAAVAPTLLPSEPLMAAVRYYQRHHEALFRFIDDANVPIDNSATEREFQNVAKLRLNVLFAGSTEGAHRACVLLGIVATCRTVGVPVQAYLTWAFERLGTHRDVFALPLEAMTPAAFKKTLD